ncbi:MAG TPA: SDR family NAD(P)-dependent oxidoreductase [Actinomycetota bacterium]|nr:SDR family NAD(P)-dependent oxidoreductase [Actinomycetota bacterium]
MTGRRGGDGAERGRPAAGAGLDLDGSVALVTGGASGIGLAVVGRLAAAGARVVVADLDEAGGAAAAAAAGGVFVATDAGDPDAVQAAVDASEAAYGGLDLVHLNAGIVTGNAALDLLDLDRYRRVVAVNLDGVVFGVRSALPALRRRGGGAIVATASLAGLTAYPGDPVYSMTKHGVVGLVRTLAEPLAADRVTINCVCPGFADTPLLDRFAGQLRTAGFPLLSADEVAAAVLTAATGGGTGQAWVCQPGRPPEPFRFRGVPGPRVAGSEGIQPPPTEPGGPS